MLYNHALMPPEARAAVHRAIAELASDIVDVATGGGEPADTELYVCLPDPHRCRYDWAMLLRCHAVLGGIGRMLIDSDGIRATCLAEQLLLDIVIKRAEAELGGTDATWDLEVACAWLPDDDHELLYGERAPAPGTSTQAARFSLFSLRGLVEPASLEDWFSSAPAQFGVQWGNSAATHTGEAVPDGPLRIVDPEDYPTGAALTAAAAAGAEEVRDLAVRLLTWEADSGPLEDLAWTGVVDQHHAQRLLLGLVPIAERLWGHRDPTREEVATAAEAVSGYATSDSIRALAAQRERWAWRRPLEPSDAVLVSACASGALRGVTAAEATAVLWKMAPPPGRLAAAAAVAAVAMIEAEANYAGESVLLEIEHGSLEPREAVDLLRAPVPGLSPSIARG